MKLASIIGLTALAVALSGSEADSQTKIGYIDSERIFNEFDEFKLARQKFDQQAKEAEGEISLLWAQLDSLQQEREMGRFTWSQSRLDAKDNEIAAKQEEIRSVTQEIFGPGGTIYKIQKELTERSMEDIVLALNKVAEEEGYDMVLDAARGLIPFKKEEEDLTDAVLEELRKGQVSNGGGG